MISLLIDVQKTPGRHERRRSSTQQHRTENNLRQPTSNLRNARQDAGRAEADVSELVGRQKHRQHNSQVFDGSAQGVPAVRQFFRGDEGDVGALRRQQA